MKRLPLILLALALLTSPVYADGNMDAPSITNPPTTQTMPPVLPPLVNSLITTLTLL